MTTPVPPGSGGTGPTNVRVRATILCRGTCSPRISVAQQTSAGDVRAAIDETSAPSGWGSAQHGVPKEFGDHPDKAITEALGSGDAVAAAH